MAFLAFVVACSFMVGASAGNLGDHIDITWGDGRGKIINSGELLTLSVDKYSGSGFQSKDEYLFGKVEMDLKLVSSNSAGTVTTLYAQRTTRSDFEFLGNLTGEPYILHTNVFAQGKGNREQQFHLWFDPTKDFHTYSIVWNPQNIIFLVDDIPIRDFKNREAKGVSFPKNQPTKVYSSLWEADDWATQGGLVKTDWTNAPFTASYKNYKANACKWSSGKSSCSSNKFPASRTDDAWFTQELDSSNLEKMRWVQKNHMVYNYCTDNNRFPQGLPMECS